MNSVNFGNFYYLKEGDNLRITSDYLQQCHDLIQDTLYTQKQIITSETLVVSEYLINQLNDIKISLSKWTPVEIKSEFEKLEDLNYRTLNTLSFEERFKPYIDWTLPEILATKHAYFYGIKRSAIIVCLKDLLFSNDKLHYGYSWVGFEPYRVIEII